jgi:tripartite-type tricarboxylate transporter receptor subunit TctC
VPPGGTLDATARLVAQRWQSRGTQVIVENRPGANMIVGAEVVARAAADGSTLLFGSTPLVLAHLLQKTSFQEDSLAPVIQVSEETFGLFSSGTGGIPSLESLAATASRRARGLDCLAIPGAGEFACEQLKAAVGGASTTVPFPGIAPATTALIGGSGDVLFAPVAPLLPFMAAGKVRLLAVSDASGLPPEVRSAPPVLGDLWKGFVLEAFTGVFAPRGTPPARLAAINSVLETILHEPEVVQAMRASAQRIVGGSPAILAERMRTARASYEALATQLLRPLPR